MQPVQKLLHFRLIRAAVERIGKVLLRLAQIAFGNADAAFFDAHGRLPQNIRYRHHGFSRAIQDKAHGLRQDFAALIIGQANDWRTRNDPTVPTARLDDMLRVTVVGEVGRQSGLVETHLSRLELGTIVIDTSFDEFLDTATIASLVRRDHYWRDEQVVVFDPSRSPVAATIDRTESDSSDALFGRLFRDPERPRVRIGLDQSSVRLAPNLYLWGGAGADELALPDFSYGRARIGLAYNRLRIWGELPLPVGSQDNPVLARRLDGAYGFGLSFEERWFGGMVSGAAAPRSPGSTGGYYISKAAILYGIVPIDIALLGDFPIRAKLGMGYLQARATADAAGTGSETPLLDDGSNALKWMIDLEYADPSYTGPAGRRASLELFGPSVRASYQQPITDVIGIRVTAAAHGIFGERDPFLPPFSITPSLTFTFR